MDHEAAEAPLPGDLYERVEALLAEHPEMPWDRAVEIIVSRLRSEAGDDGDGMMC